ncbi:MAG: 50S ribosomal protein L11 methyltransferase [Flavitalea sp.]
MENTIQFTFYVKGEEQEILLAQLSSIGFDGFEQFPDRLIACIPEKEYLFEDLQFVLDNQIPFEKITITPRNWNAEWEKSFDPVLVEDFCAIRASFHNPIPGVIHDILITPKMSFGTGHHATTFQMIRFLKDIDFKGRQVLDFGTGTGVLAILAEKLGAEKIDAFDNDLWSIENARENIESNNCVKIELKQAEEITGDKKYGIILANINKHVILAHMISIKNHCAEGGIVLFSGLLSADRQDIVNCAEQNGLSLEDYTEMENWLALKMRG